MSILKEFIENVLHMLPQSNSGDDFFDFGYEVITSMESNYFLKHDSHTSYRNVALKCRLEFVHVEQLKELIVKHASLIGYMRIMPEISEKDGVFTMYSRIQFSSKGVVVLAEGDK